MIALLISLCLLRDTTQRPPEWWLHRRGDQFQLIIQHAPVIRDNDNNTMTCRNAQVFDIRGKDAMKVLLHHWLDVDGQFMNLKAFALISQSYDCNWFPIEGQGITEPNEPAVIEPNEPVYQPVFPFVWVTSYGTKFHARDCYFAVGAVPQPLDVALNMGLTPCSYCKPLD